MVLDKSYRLNTTQEFQILLRTEKAFAWQETKRCLNSIERSAEEQKTVQEIPYTPFLRVKIKRRAVSFYDFGKHDWPLWDMTNWPKHLAEKHYFGVKHLSVESSLASHEKLQKAKFVGILESSLKSMSHENPLKSNQKSLVILWYQKLLWWGRHAIHHTYRDENYTFKDSLRI